ncbi:MAG: DUF2974 domain-containing protein [Spirochaetales bacterium]|nr:DUF2974 domain-containing protein [Candidatus Physcosoma equi]
MTLTNVLDYIEWRGDLSVSAVPFGEVDYLILSILIYARLEEVQERVGKTIRELEPMVYQKPKKEYNTYDTERKELWKAAAKTERFGTMVLDYFTEDFSPETEEQFAAAVFTTGDMGHLVFRGTDGTVTGWKEDINMAFEDEIPSQKDAVKLLESMAGYYQRISVSGHSKGGFLAVWSAFGANEEVFSKVDSVWSFDGPGLQEKYTALPRWDELAKKTHAYIPVSSVVGMIYTSMANPVIVKSKSMGILQHDAFNWHVKGNQLLRNEDTTLSSKFTDMTIKTFFEGCTAEERKTVVNTIYSIIEICGEEEVASLPEASIRNLPRIIAAMRDIPEESRKVIWELAGVLRESGKTSIKRLWTKEK